MKPAIGAETVREDEQRWRLEHDRWSCRGRRKRREARAPNSNSVPGGICARWLARSVGQRNGSPREDNREPTTLRDVFRAR